MGFIITIENLPEFLQTGQRVQDEVGVGCFNAVRSGSSEGIAHMLAVRKWKDVTGETRRTLRGSLTASNAFGAEGVMECASEIASYLDSGTVPHTIVPRSVSGKPRAKKVVGGRSLPDVGTHRVMLRWYDGGGNPVFAREVHHPGTRGDGFFGAGVQKCERVMIREIELGVVRCQAILDS